MTNGLIQNAVNSIKNNIVSGFNLGGSGLGVDGILLSSIDVLHNM